MRVLGFQPPVAVADNLALVLRAALRVLDVLNVVANGHDELVGDEVFAKQVPSSIVWRRQQRPWKAKSPLTRAGLVFKYDNSW